MGSPLCDSGRTGEIQCSTSVGVVGGTLNSGEVNLEVLPSSSGGPVSTQPQSTAPRTSGNWISRLWLVEGSQWTVSLL